MRSFRRDERGSLAPAVPLLGLMLLLVAGLGIDGSRQLNARGEALAFAEEASRAGAQAIEVDNPTLTLDPDAAYARAQQYCDEVDKLPQVVDCKPQRKIEPVSENDQRPLVVVVKVTTSINTVLLNMVGVGHLDAVGVGKARPYEGIDTPIGENGPNQQNPPAPNPGPAPPGP